MKHFLIILISLFFLVESARAQKINHLVSFRDIENSTYFRYNYDNDYFASSDKNYTQGYNFELVATFLKHNPINKLLFKPKDESKDESKDETTRFGLAIEHIGFTPDNYEFPEIQFNDRPFAAAIMLKSFSITTNYKNKTRLSSSLSLGIIGPGAFGKEMQVEIHKATGNKIPLGWRNQIKNDVVINYQFNIEKQLINFYDFFTLQSIATAKLGTLFTNASVGLNATLGIVNNPFKINSKKGFKLYAFTQPTLTVVGYDATLQGGLFNKDSPYVLSSKEVERFTSELNYGLILKSKTLYFEYSRAITSKKHTLGDSYKWGGIKIGFTF